MPRRTHEIIQEVDVIS